MSTSTEPAVSAVVLRGLAADAVTSTDATVDLRGGDWTRLGTGTVRGDAVTEATLRGLAQHSREAARAQGYAAGWAEGRRSALAAAAVTQDQQARAFDEQSSRILAEQASAAAALTTALARHEQAAATVHAELADQAVELALQIAEAVIGRELALAADPGGDALRRALTAVPVDAALQVRLHPADRASLDLAVVEDRAVTFVTDPTVARGDAVVESEGGVVDAGIAAAMTRVREVLGR